MNEYGGCETALTCIRAAKMSTVKYATIITVGSVNFCLSIFLIIIDLRTVVVYNGMFSLTPYDGEDDDSCFYLHDTFLAGARRRLTFQALWSLVNIAAVCLFAKCRGTEQEEKSLSWKTLARSWVVFHSLLTLAVSIHFVPQLTFTGFRLPELIQAVIIIFQFILLGFFAFEHEKIGTPVAEEAKTDAEQGPDVNTLKKEDKSCGKASKEETGVALLKKLAAIKEHGPPSAVKPGPSSQSIHQQLKTAPRCSAPCGARNAVLVVVLEDTPDEPFKSCKSLKFNKD